MLEGPISRAQGWSLDKGYADPNYSAYDTVSEGGVNKVGRGGRKGKREKGKGKGKEKE
jgi:hypothetical protein